MVVEVEDEGWVCPVCGVDMREQTDQPDPAGALAVHLGARKDDPAHRQVVLVPVALDDLRNEGGDR